MAKVFADKQPTVDEVREKRLDNRERPKMFVAIEHMDAAHQSLCQAMNVLGSVIFDLQKGADFIIGYRDSLIKSVELGGGDVQQSIEHQIRDFIPKQQAAE